MTDTAARPDVPILGRPVEPLEASTTAARWSFRWKELGAKHGALVAVIGYIVLAILVFLPVGPFESRQLPIAGPFSPAGADPSQMTWFLSWAPYALTHGQSLFHTNYFDYPSGVNLADNTTVPALGILGWPITATLGPVATFNFLIRLSFALSAASLFFVLRRWCRTFVAPFLAGLLYAFGPYTSAQHLHLDLVFIPLPPLFVLLFDELFRRQRMRPALLGLLIGLVSGVQFLISQEILSGCGVIAIVAAIGLAIKYRHEVRARLVYVVKALVFAVVPMAVFTGYPLYEAIRGAGHLNGPVITLGALQRTRSDLLSPLVPTSNQFAAGGLVSHIGNEFVDGNLSENGGYLGIPLLILLGVIIRRLRKDSMVMTLFLLALAAFILSLGSYLVIGTKRTPIPLPEDLFTVLPLFQSNVPARYALYVLLFVAMVVAIGIERLWLLPRQAARSLATTGGGSTDAAPTNEARAPRQRLGFVSPLVASCVAGAIVIVSLVPPVPYASRGLFWPASLPTAIERAVKPGAVVLTYPFPTPINAAPLVWAAVDHMDFRLIGGYANIAVGHRKVGQRWPRLLKPASVQEVLAYTSVGDHFPAPPDPTPQIEAQLRQYLDRYSVGAVVAFTDSRQPLAPVVHSAYVNWYFRRWVHEGLGDQLSQVVGVVWYLRRAIGAPQIQTKHFDIWLPVRGAWRAPSR